MFSIWKKWNLDHVGNFARARIFELKKGPANTRRHVSPNVHNANINSNR